jgi:hypothetical protein
MRITKKIADNMIAGASIFSTGGGFEPEAQRRLMNRLLRKGKTPELVSIDDMDGRDSVFTVYFVGSAANNRIRLPNNLRDCLGVLESETKRNFGAIFCGETNIESVVFQIASELDLPVLDADCTGGRAVPETQLDNFVICGRSPLPAVVVTPDGRDTKILKNGRDTKKIEEQVRSIANKSKYKDALVMDHPIDASNARKLLTLGTVSRSIKTGEFIKENRDPKSLVKYLGGKLLIEGRVSEVSLKDKGGFLEGYYDITGGDDEARVYVKNENLICSLNGRIIITPPDLIISIDEMTCMGIHNSRIRKHQEATLIGHRASDLWRTRKGVELFSPRRLGFDTASKLL